MTWKRVATAVVLIPFVVGLVLWGSTAMVSLAVALVTLLALFEYFALGEAIGHRAYRFWTATCALALVYMQWLASTASVVTRSNYTLEFYKHGVFSPYGSLSPTFLSSYDVFFLFILGVTAITLFTRRPLVETLPAAGISSSGLLLIAFPLSYAVRLHGIETFGHVLLLFALVITWAGDTAAYFVGRAVGKRLFAPRLSPQKTWEGAIASFLASALAGVVFARWIFMPLPHLLAMVVVGNIAGQTGDLLESAYKRSAGIKDSGGLLPGHGGVLDRIDALILAIPVVWYYWNWIYSPK